MHTIFKCISKCTPFSNASPNAYHFQTHLQMYILNASPNVHHFQMHLQMYTIFKCKCILRINTYGASKCISASTSVLIKNIIAIGWLHRRNVYAVCCKKLPLLQYRVMLKLITTRIKIVCAINCCEGLVFNVFILYC